MELKPGYYWARYKPPKWKTPDEFEIIEIKEERSLVRERKLKEKKIHWVEVIGSEIEIPIEHFIDFIGPIEPPAEESNGNPGS